MLTNLPTATLEQFGVGQEPETEARRIAGKLFDGAHSRGKLGQWWARLSGADLSLESLPGRAETARRTTRTISVPLEKIVGSEGRSEDFDANFNPLKAHNRERWISVAAARRTGITLPAVELVQIGPAYYVRDGHHRISVAKVMGQLDIEARIVN